MAIRDPDGRMIVSLILLSSGYCALDVIRHAGEVGHHCGGTAANVAANAAHLGWSTFFTGRLGQDLPGDLILEDLAAAGVDTALVARDMDVATPVVLHDATPPIHRFRFSCPKCGRDLPKYRPMTPTQAGAVLDAFGDTTPAVFFFDRASASCLALAERFRAAGTIVVFEPSVRGNARRSMHAANLAHLVKWSAERRARLRSEIFVARIDQWQIETLGAAGLRVRRGGDVWSHVPGFAVEVVDAAGAGDWVSATLLTDLGTQLPSASLEQMVTALTRAQAIAALNCSAVGARALAAQPRATVDRAAAALLHGVPSSIVIATSLTRRYRPDACTLCLAPVPVASTC